MTADVIAFPRQWHAGPPSWTDFRSLAGERMRAARSRAGMEPGEFRDALVPLVRFKFTTETLGRWEAGSSPPAEVLLAAEAIAASAAR